MERSAAEANQETGGELQEVKLMRRVWEEKCERVTKVIEFMRDDLINWANAISVKRKSIVDMENHINRMASEVGECMKEMKPLPNSNEEEWNGIGLFARMTASEDELSRLIRKANEKVEGVDLSTLIDMYAEKVVEIERLQEQWREVRARLIEENEEVTDDEVVDKLKEVIKSELESKRMMKGVLDVCGVDDVVKLGEVWISKDEERQSIEKELQEEMSETEEIKGISLQEVARKRMERLRVLNMENQELKLKIVETEGMVAELKKQLETRDEIEDSFNKAIEIGEEKAKREREELRQRIGKVEREKDALLSLFKRWHNQQQQSRGGPKIEENRKGRVDENRKRERERRAPKAATRLPPMKVYSGRKEEFEDFRVAFEIRYGDEDKKTAVALLREVLVGEAKEEYRNIPEGTKKEGAKACLDYLEKRLSEESPFYKIELEQKMRDQRLNGRTVAKVCEEVEKWVNKLHKDEERKEERRVTQIMSLYKATPEYIKLLELFESGESYQAMKDHLIRVEFIARQMSELRGGMSVRRGDISSSKLECFNCHRIGNGIRPFVPRSHRANKVEVRDESERDCDEGSEGEMYSRKIEPVMGIIGGNSMEVILDTGAEVSLISMKRIEEMSGVTLEENTTTGIVGASGKSIVIVAKCILDVQLPVGRKIRTGFFVARDALGDADQVILGIPALRAMGIGLVELPREAQGNVHVAGEKAKVKKELTLGAGEIGNVLVRTGKGQNARVSVLWSERDEVVDGILTLESGVKNVYVPVINLSNENITFKEDERDERDRKRREDILIEWKNHQDEDQWVREMIECMGQGSGVEGEEYIIPNSNKKITINDCVLKDGLLHIIGEDHKPRLYVPEGVREKLVKDVHENPLVGHIGARRLIEMMKKEVYWGAMLRDIPTWIKKCVKCTLANSQKRFIPPLQPRIVTRNDYKNTLVLMMERTVNEVRNRLEEERKRMSKKYDEKYRNNKAKEPQKGDRVYVRNEMETNKVGIPWEGPFRVDERSTTTATLVDLRSGVKGKKKVVQLDRLRIDGKKERIRMKYLYDIEKGSPLHLDGHCTDCGTVRAATLAPGVTGTLGEMEVSTMREACRVWDMEAEKKGTLWGLLDATRRMKEEKEPSMDAIRAVYGGGCIHRIALIGRIPEGSKVELEGERRGVNKAIGTILVVPSKKEDTEKHGYPSVLLLTEDSWMSPRDGDHSRIEVTLIDKEGWEEGIRKWSNGEENRQGTVIIMIPDIMSSETMEVIREEARRSVEANEEMTVLMVPSFVRERASQYSIECHERIMDKMEKWELDEVEENTGQERLKYGTGRRWNQFGVPIGMLPMVAKTWGREKAEEAILAGCGQGKGVRLGEERREDPPEKRQRLAGGSGVRKDASNSLKRPNREGCFLCLSTDHLARECSKANNQWTGNRIFGNGRGRGGDRGGRGGDRGGRGGYGGYGGYGGGFGTSRATY
uniref:RNA-directed DNA polymerase n=1 Tax=Pristionchus pacificus TaxID=54126 RepID=A0A8R1Z0V9_PRIPA